MEYDISKLLSVGSLELELSLILQKTACGFLDWPLFYIVSFYADVTFYKKNHSHRIRYIFFTVLALAKHQKLFHCNVLCV